MEIFAAAPGILKYLKRCVWRGKQWRTTGGIMALTSKSKYADQYVDPVGKSVPRLEGRGVVTGQLKYAFDISFPNMLVGKMLRSPHAHARIVSIDTSKAEALEGVKAVVTARDTHQIKFGSN